MNWMFLIYVFSCWLSLWTRVIIFSFENCPHKRLGICGTNLKLLTMMQKTVQKLSHWEFSLNSAAPLSSTGRFSLFQLIVLILRAANQTVSVHSPSLSSASCRTHRMYCRLMHVTPNQNEQAQVPPANLWAIRRWQHSLKPARRADWRVSQSHHGERKWNSWGWKTKWFECTLTCNSTNGETLMHRCWSFNVPFD